ncbi:hypothetical protein I6M73_16230, partial [Acinetobacter pittii]
DYVSYSQLQEEKRHKDNPKARKSSSKTVSKGLEELISLGVISVISTHPKLGNQYKINEVSLSDHFTKESTSPSTALYLVKHEHFTKESTSTLPSKDTIDNTYRNIYRESDSQQNQVEEVLKIWEPDLHQLNSWMQRSGLPKINQAQVEELLLEINPHYENKIHTGAVTSTQMYSNFVKWVKRDFKLVEKLFKQAEQNNTQAINPENLETEMGDW